MITSYGLALARKNHNNGQYELLFIKKRLTYAYITFVKGIYNKNNENELLKLFNGMTIEEKICISSLNFNIIWHKSYLTLPNKLTLKDLTKYENCKSKFEKRFLQDEGKRLLKLIKNTKSAYGIWEMPKGMVNKNESEINAAIREFYEETGIKKHKYKILYDKDPVVYTFIDDNTTYRYIYYLSVMLDSKYQPSIELSFDKNSSIMESMDIKFFNINYISLIYAGNNNFINFVKNIFKIIKKHCI